MTSRVSSVITIMILKEIVIEMRNQIVKIKRISEKQEYHYQQGVTFGTEKNTAFLLLILG
jgi:hypothetical protein